jgi:hypothetical protein
MVRRRLSVDKNANLSPLVLGDLSSDNVFPRDS